MFARLGRPGRTKCFAQRGRNVSPGITVGLSKEAGWSLMSRCEKNAELVAALHHPLRALGVILGLEKDDGLVRLLLAHGGAPDQLRRFVAARGANHGLDCSPHIMAFSA
jgi:hypothetical protein